MSEEKKHGGSPQRNILRDPQPVKPVPPVNRPFESAVMKTGGSKMQPSTITSIEKKEK